MYETIRNQLEREGQAIVTGLTLKNIGTFRKIMRDIERKTQHSYSQFYYGNTCLVEQAHTYN